jgi:hypothetical protein
MLSLVLFPFYLSTATFCMQIRKTCKILNLPDPPNNKLNNKKICIWKSLVLALKFNIDTDEHFKDLNMQQTEYLTRDL